MRKLAKKSGVILFVFCLSGCAGVAAFGIDSYKVKPIAENVRKIEWFDKYGVHVPRKDTYEVMVEGDWYEATFLTEMAPEPEVLKRENFELTPRAKRRLSDYRRDGDGGGGEGDGGEGEGGGSGGEGGGLDCKDPY